MSSYAIAFTVFLAACFGGQSLALRQSGGKTVKSESNYFSSVARIQTETRGAPRVMLLGSSMTGRLADRGAELPGVANLGCDGGSAVVTLRAMDRGLLPAAPVLVIEANTLSYALENRGREIAAAIGSDWFKLGTRLPNVGATARPTAFAYSWLMARKESSAPSSGELSVSTKPVRLSAADAPALEPAASTLVDELAGILGRLEAKGSRVILVMLPPGVKTGCVQTDLPRALACKTGLPWWDLNEGIAPGSVGFTDGLHLDAPSASKVLAAIVRGVAAP